VREWEIMIHSNNDKTNGRCYLIELTKPGVSVPLSFNICAVVNEFIARLPFRVWRWGYRNTWVAFILFLELYFLDWLGLWVSGSSDCIPQMGDQGHSIPLQQIRPTHYEEQPSAYLRFLWDPLTMRSSQVLTCNFLISIRNRGTIPDGPKPTTSWTMCSCRMQPNTVSAWRWRLPQMWDWCPQYLWTRDIMVHIIWLRSSYITNAVKIVRLIALEGLF
jgi:hypothetical protein